MQQKYILTAKAPSHMRFINFMTHFQGSKKQQMFSCNFEGFSPYRKWVVWVGSIMTPCHRLCRFFSYDISIWLYDTCVLSGTICSLTFFFLCVDTWSFQLVLKSCFRFGVVTPQSFRPLLWLSTSLSSTKFFSFEISLIFFGGSSLLKSWAQVASFLFRKSSRKVACLFWRSWLWCLFFNPFKGVTKSKVTKSKRTTPWLLRIWLKWLRSKFTLMRRSPRSAERCRTCRFGFPLKSLFFGLGCLGNIPHLQGEGWNIDFIFPTCTLQIFDKLCRKEIFWSHVHG